MIHDLSIPLSEATIPFLPAGDPPLNWRHLTEHQAGAQVSLFTMGTHLGTHVDLPLHYVPGGKSAARADLSRFCGEAVCLAVSDFPETGVFDLTATLEKNRDLLRPGDILLLSTGWEDRLGTASYFVFPDFHENTGALLARFGVKSLGFDLPSVDTSGAAHLSLLSREMGLIESLVNLKSLAGRRFFFSAAPLKFSDGDGSPVRAYAMTED